MSKKGKGLSGEHHGLLNRVLGLPKGIYNQMRQQYAGDKVAQQQIDVYDGSTEYHKKLRLYKKALQSGDKQAERELKQWFDENYPDI